MPLYLPPTLEPERTIPPGNGMIAPGTLFIAASAASAAASAWRLVRAMNRRLPPPTPSPVMPVLASQRNSPSITGMRQKCRPANFLEICQPSAK